MEFFKKDSLILKICVFMCSAMILFLSPCARYLDTYHIDKVHAVGGAAVVEGVTVAWEWLVGLFAASGLGAVAYENREALASSYDEYLQAQIDTELFIGDKVKETCVQVYDKASDTIQNIPWQDYLDSIKDFHDVAVDDLTDVYVKVCPSLLGTYEDFISSIFAGEIVVPGISDYISEQSNFFTYDDFIEQRSGNLYTVKGHFGATEYFTSADWYYEISTDVNKPLALHCFMKNIDGKSWPCYKVYCASSSTDIGITNISTHMLQYDKKDGHIIYQSTYGENSFQCCNIASINLPVFSSLEACEAYLLNGAGVKDALNYTRSIYDNIIDNDDLPTIGRFGRELWERVAEAPDWGIGTYGDGAIVNDWADDLPFVGLDDLWEYSHSRQDVFEKVIDDIINGVYDPTVDIPDIPDTYIDAWQDVIDKGWDDVIDNPVNNPADDPTKPVDPSIPVNPDKPLNPDIPIEDVIDIPIEDVVPTVNDSLFDVAGSIRYKFPFSIPWDLRYLFTVLADTPKAPYFELPIVIERYGINEKIIVDLKPYEKLSVLSRSLFSLLFAIGLIKLTFLVVGMRKEE